MPSDFCATRKSEGGKGMDVIKRLTDAGFAPVFALDGPSCGVEERTVLLAVMAYEAEAEPAQTGAWVHPYYFASQKAYQAAVAIAHEAESAGEPLQLRDELRVKPIFSRMPGMNQGRNTLSYLPRIGSRFHVQIFTWDQPMTPTVILEAQPHPLQCGSCKRCLAACPTGALDEEGFHREKCLRNWQLNGQAMPEDVREKMGNRFIGCDECQRCCPHNPKPSGETHGAMALDEILSDAKSAAKRLKGEIGANLALPNRVLSQACVLAGCSGDASLLPLLRGLTGHPSPVVAAHSAWAVARLSSENSV